MGKELFEAGEALRELADTHYDVIVIGGGQAGLSVGHHLARRGLRFVILESNDRVGDSWRKRWDSLTLFTPARFDALPGLPFPGDPASFPSKDAMADYLEQYARHFRLPVRTGARVSRLSMQGSGYRVELEREVLEADQVVIAMAGYQQPRVPALAAELDDSVVQMHSSEYRSPAQLAPGSVLVVGAGNSGAEIALELARAGFATTLAGRDVGQLPFRVGGLWGRLLLVRLVLRVIFHRIVTVRTPIGRAMRPTVLRHSGPLIRTKWADLEAVGVVRAPRVSGVRDGLPLLEDGSRGNADNVIWCTGYDAGFSWVDLPIFDEDGRPEHESGVATRAPGLYFVGLTFLHSLSSSMVHGVGRDAARVVSKIGARARAHHSGLQASA
ncbi:MAG: NAD(P)-binding domain-containing protein [Polyangiaceae bacterium]|nr:NAD(P)-binding domain-containing protein [Polyangiaceae bacterium]